MEGGPSCGRCDTMNQMTVATFDTLAAVRNLEKAGMGTAQAEAVTDTIRVAVFQGVATKEDLAESRAATSAEIGELRTELSDHRAATAAEFAAVRTELAAHRAATSAELAEHRAATKADIADLRTELREGNANLRADFEKLRAGLFWLIPPTMATLLGILVAVDRLFLN